jgi:predicted  nucleic acid-binding Zn-ribbon protein
MEQLEGVDNSRKKLKTEFQEASDKIISLEEELYGSKTVQVELLEQLKQLEDKFEDAVNRLEETEK